MTKVNLILFGLLLNSPCIGPAIADTHIIGGASYSGIPASNNPESPPEHGVHGTPARVEYEFKFASNQVANSLSPTAVIRSIHKELVSLIQNEKLTFGSLSKQPYNLDENTQAFVFLDYYLDTPALLVYRKNSAYRLRYRWAHVEKYYRHQLFPFLKVFHPDRCEIQFKQGYQRDQINQTVSVNESRFEFRQESSPFSSGIKPPPSPWPVTEFLGYATSGNFKGYGILPYFELKKMLARGISGVPSLQLKPIMKVTTERYRVHLNMTNLWGVGPNPDHVFIVTFDVSTAMGLVDSKKSDLKFFELEVEIDRNVSTEVDRIRKMKNIGDDEDPMTSKAIEISQKAREMLDSDLHVIKQHLTKLLKDKFGLRENKVDNKYSRFVKVLGLD